MMHCDYPGMKKTRICFSGCNEIGFVYNKLIFSRFFEGGGIFLYQNPFILFDFLNNNTYFCVVTCGFLERDSCLFNSPLLAFASRFQRDITDEIPLPAIAGLSVCSRTENRQVQPGRSRERERGKLPGKGAGSPGGGRRREARTAHRGDRPVRPSGAPESFAGQRSQKKPKGETPGTERGEAGGVPKKRDRPAPTESDRTYEALARQKVRTGDSARNAAGGLSFELFIFAYSKRYAAERMEGARGALRTSPGMEVRV